MSKCLEFIVLAIFDVINPEIILSIIHCKEMKKLKIEEKHASHFSRTQGDSFSSHFGFWKDESSKGPVRPDRESEFSYYRLWEYRKEYELQAECENNMGLSEYSKVAIFSALKWNLDSFKS